MRKISSNHNHIYMRNSKKARIIHIYFEIRKFKLGIFLYVVKPVAGYNIRQILLRAQEIQPHHRV